LCGTVDTPALRRSKFAKDDFVITPIECSTGCLKALGK